ncbi:MAG: hypothetical protein EAZ07_06055 [Cytophagales bacterium]|nr:MAG: hypothetical protein EAZ07_06055 [Cytophagales bacterium]
MKTFSPETFASNYSTYPNRFDELLDSKQELRNHWLGFEKTYQNLGKTEFDNRCDELKRLLRENGVTYNVYGDVENINRPWKLDPIPFIINQKEWALLEIGIKQRAKLLNLILIDIYGKKELFQKGLLPLELIYNHSGFVRQANGINLQNQTPLTLYASDIARNNKGEYWVISDRTQAPSGLGYCLENRSVMSRSFSDFFKETNIRKLSSYAQIYRTAINSIAPNQSDAPKIVLLSPGPHNETFFEHAYVASFMGYTLVQGDDLVVRENNVWLKSLEGLEKVDVIIRRVDDLFCDPLELKEESQLGIPGLLEVIRSGNVAVANSIGSAVLENPGLMAFLPSICKHYLDEELIIPSIASWWCGQKSELAYVLEHLQDMKIKTIYRQEGRSTISEGNLSKKELELLKQKIISKPYLYVGQELIDVASTPSYTHGKLEPRFAAFRNFAVAYKNDYHCMPGGLTRSSDQKDIFKVSNQLGGYSKDTWILGSEPPIQLSLPLANVQKAKLKQDQSISSRAAENLYWVGRYVERIRINARFLNVVLDHLNQSNKTLIETEQAYTNNLLYSLTHLTMSYPGFLDPEKSKELLSSPFHEIIRIIFDTKISSSLASNIQNLKRSIYSIRDKFSLYTWRAVYKLEEEWQDLLQSQHHNYRSINHALDNIIIYLSALMEMNSESTVKEHSFMLLDIGRRIEKALLITSLIRSTFSTKHEDAVESKLMEAILISCSSLNTYRSRYRGQLSISATIDLLLLDNTNSSSLAYQIEAIKNCMEQLPDINKNYAKSEEQKTIFEIYALLKLSDPSKLVATENDNDLRVQLEHILSKITTQLVNISGLITTKYFSHLHATQQSFTQALESDEI